MKAHKSWLKYLALLIVVVLAAAGVIVACGGGGGSSDGGGGGGGEIPEASETIGSDGGTVEVTDPNSPIYGSKIEIPEGALTEETVITISSTELPKQLQAKYSAKSECIQFGPLGLIFAKPVIITLPYSQTQSSQLDKCNSMTVGLVFFELLDIWKIIQKIINNDNNNRLEFHSNYLTYYLVADTSSDDNCPTPNGGIIWNGRKRFMYGINYAWSSPENFGTDFGGCEAWGQKGVSDNTVTIKEQLFELKSNGANVIRWWLWPEFRSDGVLFDNGDDTPLGLSNKAREDILKALEIANELDLYIMFCILSFDNFKESRTEGGIWIPSIHSIVTDENKLSALITNVVTPLAETVQNSPYAKRMIAWDIINEPEWAIRGINGYGDEEYKPETDLTVEHQQMEVFIQSIVNALKTTEALITVGGAAIKWKNAWSRIVGLDFYQFHMYHWVNEYWPYTDDPSIYDLDKPIVIGEFPLGNLDNGISYSDVINAFWENGYAGALSWSYTDNKFNGDLIDMRNFACLHQCETTYDDEGDVCSQCH